MEQAKGNGKNKNKFIIRRIIVLIIVVLLIVTSYIIIKNITKGNDEPNTNMQEKNDKEEDDKKEEMSEREKALLDRNGEKLESLPILMYHFFYDESIGETGQDSNWMEVSSFEEQMKYLSDNNYYYPSWDEVYGFVNGDIDLPVKSVVVTIDDGSESFFRLAIPILEKYNVHATSFIITSWVGKDTVDEYSSDILIFRSHSHDMHRPGRDGQGAFLTMTEEEASNDLETSKSIVGSSDVFCYPFGHTNDFTSRMLTEMEYKLAVTTKPGRVVSGNDPLFLTRVRMSKGDSLNVFIERVK